jgi:hypothetical protein
MKTLLLYIGIGMIMIVPLRAEQTTSEDFPVVGSLYSFATPLASVLRSETGRVLAISKTSPNWIQISPLRNNFVQLNTDGTHSLAQPFSESYSEWININSYGTATSVLDYDKSKTPEPTTRK